MANYRKAKASAYKLSEVLIYISLLDLSNFASESEAFKEELRDIFKEEPEVLIEGLEYLSKVFSPNAGE